MYEDTATEMEEKTDDKPESSEKFLGFNKNLIMLKLTLFFLYGATSSLLPYLTIHMQSIGLNMEDVAFIYLSLPFTTFLAPPLTGYLVDKFGKYKPVVIVSFLLTAVLHHSLLYFPQQELPGVIPSGYVITHPKKMYVEVWWSPCPSRECPEEEELDVILDMCADHCLLKKNKKAKPISINGLTQANISESDPGDQDDLVFHLGKNKNKTSNLNETVAQFTLDMHPNLGDPIEQFGIEVDSAEEGDVMELQKRFSKGLLKRFGVNITDLEDNDLRCGGIVLEANFSTKSRLKDYSSDCILQKCQFRQGGPEVCPPDYKESDNRTFWTYFFLRFTGTVILTAGVTIMDPIALAMIEKYGGDFGKERLFSSLGMALFSPITGYFIDKNSEEAGYTDYSPAFYTFDILLLISAIAVFMMPLGTKLPADNLFNDLIDILKMPKVVLFIIFLFILGNLWGFIESFLFFYLRDLGAPNALLGVTVTVGTLSSLPFLYGAENITNKLGHVNIIIIAFFAHAARLMGYSVIESAWWCFPFEAMESLSVHLMWVAAATYCTVLAPKGLLATLIGVCGMAHFSIGRGSGSFVGGHIIGKFGIRQSFRLMGMVAVGSGLAYAFLYWTWLKNIEKGKILDEEKQLKTKDGEPKFKDQSTMVSLDHLERLSLVVKYNQIGSLTSLGRNHIMRTRSNSIRRGSYAGAASKKNSKNDLLKSTIEVNNHQRNSSTNIKTSNVILNKLNTNSVAGLYPELNLSMPKLPERRLSIASPDRELENSILNEKDEILYDEIKHKSKDPVP